MKDTCTVINKSSGAVVYTTAVGGRRAFSAREKIRNVPVIELEQLAQQPGGSELLYHFLLIEDKEIVDHLLNADMPLEYWFKEEELPNWMNICSLAEFQDALDFAPEGTKDIIKKLAVSMPLNDYNKRKAIKEQLGFDVDAAVTNTEDEAKAAAATKPATRRVISTESEAPKRRVIVEDK